MVERPIEKWVRTKSSDLLTQVEVVSYTALGLLLTAAVLVALAGVTNLLWTATQDWTGTAFILQVIDRLLFVLVLVEIIHTVRSSIATHKLMCEPFLIVGLIATVRRLLVLTLDATNLTKPEEWANGGESRFHAAMMELGVLAVLILVLMFAIHLLRKSRPAEASEPDPDRDAESESKQGNRTAPKPEGT